MKELVQMTTRLIIAVKKAHGRKWSFLGVFALVFMAAIGILGSLDLLPEPVDFSAMSGSPLVSNQPVAAEAATPVAIVEEPIRIDIPAIRLTSTIENPTTTNIEALDKLLLKGAVRYPTSAKLGENGNVVLFGHSSYLPVVLNPAYKTFNGIQKLVAGDVVTISSSGTAYTYRVRSVSKESAESAGILLSVTGRVLTLSTCDSFGAKSDRFVVTADFVESHSISI
jgi:LPXTG-site transpeptidase (sortase) family protein